MNDDFIIDVIDRLIGDYKPYGETNHDRESNDNLNILCNVVAYYIAELYKITKNKKRVEYSIKESGMIADDFFYQMSDYFNDWEKENESRDTESTK